MNLPQDPIAILFKEKLDRNKQPLFKSQTELAHIINKMQNLESERSQEEVEKSFRSIRAIVNQTLRGYRNASEVFLTGLKFAITDRLNESIHLENFFNELKLKIEQKHVFTQNENRDIIDNRKTLYYMSQRATKASSIHITTCEPAESLINQYNYPEISKMIKELLDILGILDSEPQDCHIKFYFPTRAIAYQFWAGLLESAIHITGLEKGVVVEKLKFVNTQTDDAPYSLQVYTAPPESGCFIPLVLFDVENENIAQGFYTSVNESGSPDSQQLTNTTIGFWKKYTLPVLEEKAEPYSFYDQAYQDYCKTNFD